MFDELGDFVEAEPGAQTQGPRLDLEGRKPRGLCSHVQADAQNAVDGLLEGLAGLARFGAKLGCHVVVKSQGRSHIMMLLSKHHGVKRQATEVSVVSYQWSVKSRLAVGSRLKTDD